MTAEERSARAKNAAKASAKKRTAQRQAKVGRKNRVASETPHPIDRGIGRSTTGTPTLPEWGPRYLSLERKI